MSASDYYQPHVSINGRQLNESRGLHGLSPVADIQIKWGGNDWWENIDPSRLSMTILDPHGELLSLERGVDVTVTIDPLARVLFRGTLDASRATLSHVQNARGEVVPVWSVEIEAFDPLAALAADRQHGPYYLARNAQINKLHWGRSLIFERHSDLQGRCDPRIIWRYPDWMKQLDDVLGVPDNPVAPYTTQQNVSVLTVLRQTARIENPLNRPFYDHERGEVRLVKPLAPVTTPARNAEVATINGKISLNRYSVSTAPATELDAAHIRADAGRLSLSLKPQDNLYRCAIKSRYLMLRPADTAAGINGTYYEMAELEPPRSVSAQLGDGATAELETDLIFTFNQGVPSALYDGLATLMRATHAFRLPPVFSVAIGKKALTGERTVFERLFRAQPTYNLDTDIAEGFTLVNTPLQWAGTLPSFSVVGGELRYTARSGWMVTCNPATIPTQPTTGTTLGNVTNALPISQAADRYTVADLQAL